MSDVFREVDEDLRREQLKNVWQRYGTWIIAAAVLIIVAVAGYRIWVSIQDGNAQASGDQYQAAVDLGADGDLAGAQAGLAEVAATGAADYPTIARMREATIMAEAGDIAGAAAAFDEVANSGADVSLRSVARVRAAMLLLDTAPFSDIRARLEPMLGDPLDPYRFIVREVLALSAIRANELTLARGWLLDTLQDAAPDATLQRAGVLIALVDGRQAPPTTPPAP